MNIEYQKIYSYDEVLANPEKVYVFGDNLDKSGCGGQAVIRYCHNAFGVPTKRYPSMHEGAFFKDKECERNHVLTALRELYTIGKNRRLVFPVDGIGTGRARMKEKSPLIYHEMCEILQKHFGVRNGNV